ncbi:serine/threonine-protein kinase nekl-2-like isoform X1 [Argopecten irradians]|uniref:serine/threonine-protein kinase nekl-2-like isoform X1 n=1 Tax=Argopecten irradians TaxID=31199 RepID=UPI003721DADC
MARVVLQKEKFGEYVEIELIGKGTFGKVYLVKKSDDKGKDDSEVQKYALKKIRFPDTNRDRQEELVQREEDILKAVNHVNVVRYVDSFRDKDNVYMVMEYCSGGTLHSYIRDLNNSMEEDNFLNFMNQITKGLKYLHRKDIMHRDIKTKNIMISSGHVLKICDFGISKFRANINSVWMGTPRYMSPEIVKKHPYEFKTDIWSLGCTAYEMAVSEYLFKADTLDKIFEDIRSDKVPDMTRVPYCEDLKTLIKKMLEVSPEKRPTAKEVLKIIDNHECTPSRVSLATPSLGQRRGTESEQSTVTDNTPETQGIYSRTDTGGDSGLGVSSKMKRCSSKAKKYLERASTEFQTMLVEIIHSRDGVDIVKDIKTAVSLEEAGKILKQRGNARVNRKFQDVMKIVESLYNIEKEINRLEDVDASFSSLESFFTCQSTMSQSRSRKNTT